MTSLQLSIVIPVYNNWWLTARCLRALDALRTGSRVTFETIVVDNASTDETPHAVSHFPWVRYLRHEENRNFAGACNAGVRSAQAPITLMLNNDAYPLGDAVMPLVAAFDRPEVAIAGGALFFEDGVTQAAGLVMLPNEHWHYYCRNLPPELASVTESREALGVSGAAMAVRTQWFVKNAGFDESFINGFEDVDLCMRAREEGRTIAYVAGARFAHYEAASEGRFAREAENERRFYDRWAWRLNSLPRTVRGDVGAIIVRSCAKDDSLLAAALEDLAAGLRSFGHPLVRGNIAPWRWFDRRFRCAATLGWFEDETPAPGIAIQRNASGAPVIQTHGATSVEVPWLPCASSERVAALSIRRSDNPKCNVVGIVGNSDDVRAFQPSTFDLSFVPITPQMLLNGAAASVACVVHLGLTDDSAFGNVLLAQAGVPAIVLDRNELRGLFAPDVSIVAEPGALSDSAARLVADPAARARYGDLIAADARRRFSPRRSAIRVVDLLCAARFGWERPVGPEYLGQHP